MGEGGAHDRRRYVALAWGLHAAKRTGLLEIRAGRRWRRIHLVGGRPALFSSSVAGERLFRALEDGGLVERSALRGLGASELDEDGLARALVAHNCVDAAELRRQRTRLMERGLGASIGWEAGTWSFVDHGDHLRGRYDPALLPPVNLPGAIWAAARTMVHMEEVLAEVSDAAAGPFVPADDLGPRVASLGLTGPLAGLARNIDADGTPLDELFRRLPDRSGHLVVLLWLLEAAGVLRRPGRPLDDEQAALASGRNLPEAPPEPEPEPDADTEPLLELEPLDDPPPPPAPAPSRKRKAPSMPARKLRELVRADHQHRMGKDFYAFLDLPPGSSDADIEATAAQLAGPWEEAAEGAHEDAELEALASDLVAAARLVVSSLCDPRKRREYDKRMEAGSPPLVQGLNKVKPRQAAFSTPGAPVPGPDAERPARAEARRLLAEGDWAGAIARLAPLREEDPSDVDVLADLGWASWKAKRDPDFIRLAVTFDSSNARALEYLGRVYGELGEEDKVARIARTLLKVDRTNPGAKSVTGPASTGRRR